MIKFKIVLLIMCSILVLGCNNTKTNNNTDSGNFDKTVTLEKNDDLDITLDDNKIKNTASTKNDNIKNKVIDYILNGQEDKPEANKLKWSESFLNKVHFDNLYEQYITDGGKSDNIQSFAEYITNNAPVLNDWESTFKADLFNNYGVEVSKIENIDGGIYYQAYIKNNGEEVPYVTVSARTGYYHG